MIRKTLVSTIMSKDVITVQADDSMRKAMDLASGPTFSSLRVGQPMASENSSTVVESGSR